MPNQNHINRRTFLNILGTSIAGGFLLLWYKISGREDSDRSDQIRRVKLPAVAGISFYESFYLVTDKSGTRAFSAICTHAGCLLKSEKDGIITCPCHGSKYEAANGRVLKGPSLRNLDQLDCRQDQKTREWVIRLD